ncbi:MAG: hypothetical protein GX596_05300 [Propionibacterium sp.]|nr:hypothetical protein [Propionibacterium sp.]
MQIAVGLVVLGVLGAVTYGLFWDPRPAYTAAPNDAAEKVTDEELEQAADQRVFFGHMSVGNNIMSGMRQIYSEHGVAAPGFVQAEIGEVPAVGEGAFVHTLIGENRHPYRKLDNFEAMVRGGLGDQVDVALVKFCYIDVRWNSDVDHLFNEYKQTMDALEADYPNVRFVHVTAPLTTGPYGIKDHVKQVVGRDDNANRERYNAHMREAYGEGRLLDLAQLEGTAPDGTVKGELYGGYSSDGAHLNETGASLAAVEFVRMLNER